MFIFCNAKSDSDTSKPFAKSFVTKKSSWENLLIISKATEYKILFCIPRRKIYQTLFVILFKVVIIQGSTALFKISTKNGEFVEDCASFYLVWEINFNDGWLTMVEIGTSFIFFLIFLTFYDNFCYLRFMKTIFGKFD